MDEKDKTIASLRKQLQEALSKNRALVQEVELLKFQSEKKPKQPHLRASVPLTVSPERETL